MPLSKKVTPTKNVSQNAGTFKYVTKPRRIRKIASKARTSSKAARFVQGIDINDKSTRPFPNAPKSGKPGVGTA